RHELLEDRGAEATTRGALAHRLRLVEAHEDANNQIVRVAYEPGVFFFVRGASLARNGMAQFCNRGGRTALDDTFHHRRDLVGRHRVKPLVAVVDQFRFRLVLPGLSNASIALAIVMLVDGLAIAILDAVDQRRLDILAAIRHHGIGRYHAHYRGFAGTERVRDRK